MTGFASAASIRHANAEMVRPPRRVHVSDAARDTLRIALPGGYIGPFDPDIAPYMIEPANMLTSRQHEAVVFVGSSRSSKTLSLLDAWHTYTVTCDPGDMGLFFPTQELAADYTRRRINRNHRNSPDLGKWLSSFAHDDNIHLKVYRHGMMLSLAWPTSSQMAQRDLRYVGLSDYDAMPQNVDGEGSPFSLGSKRTTTYMSAGMTVVESSPRFDIIDPRWKPETPHQAPPVTAGILLLYNQGDRRRLYWQCVHCREWFEPTFKLLEWVDSDDIEECAESAVMPCPHCGGIHGPDLKHDLNAGHHWVPDGMHLTQNGQLRGEPPRSTIASYWAHGPVAAFQTWASLVANFLRAYRDWERTGDENALRSTVNIDQGMPYLPKAKQSQRTPDELIERSQVEEWDIGHVPHGVRFLLGLVDVQKNRFVVQVHGYGVGLEWWLVDRFEITRSARVTSSGDPAALDPSSVIEDWEMIVEKVMKRRYLLADGSGRKMAVWHTFCDSGGKAGVTSRAYDFWRRLRRRGLHRRFSLVKGETKQKNTDRVTETYPDSSRRKGRKANARGEIPVLMINSNVLKDDVAADLRRKEVGPGYAHIPPWVPREVFDEITAEVRLPKGWDRPGNAPNEAFDLAYYGKAGAIFLGAERWGDEWESAPPWAAEWDQNTAVETGEVSEYSINADDYKVL